MAEQLDLATIKNCVFLYTKIAEPVLTKDARDRGIQPNPNDPLANSEWTLNIAIPEKTFKALKKKFPKATNFNNAKDWTTEEFNEKFFASGENVPTFEGDDIVTIKFSQKCRTAKGKDTKPPEVIGIRGRIQDEAGLTVNSDVLIGNGSVGHLQIRPVEFTSFNSMYLYPQCLCVVKLVEYHGAGPAAADYEAFGIQELPEVDVDELKEEMEDDQVIPF